MEIGEKIRKLRKGKYTQEELAECMGIHPNTLRRWEAGKRSPDVSFIPKLAELLGVTVSELINGGDGNDGIINSKGISAPKEISVPTSKSSKWMLIYERDGERLELPPTEQGYAIFNNIAHAIANRSGMGGKTQTSGNLAMVHT